jgi:ABC-type transport system involved in Fe-S cluster assembly fused permease/ATPase subunit
MSKSHHHKHSFDNASPDAKRSNLIKSLGQLGPYLWPLDQTARIRFVLAIACLLLSKVFSILIPVFFKRAVDALDKPADLIPYVPYTPILLPIFFLIAYGAARILTGTFAEFRDLIFAKVEGRAIREAALRVFKHLHALSLQFHLDRKTGGLNRAIERGTDGIEMALRFLSFSIIPTFVEILLVCLFLLAAYPWIFALITFATMFSYLVFTIVVTEWRTKYVRAMNIADEEGHAKAIDSLLNYETVKYFGNEALEAQRFDKSLGHYEQAMVKMKTSLALLNIGQNLIISGGMVAVTWLTALGVMNRSLTLGDFVLMNAYLLQLYLPLSNLGFAYRETRRALVNMEEMLDLLRIKSTVQDTPDSKVLRLDGGSVKLENISFSYQPDRQILKNISFEIPAGKTVALVGASGSGKSTIARLLFRFYDPTEGSILIDGQNIRETTQKSVRSHIAVVPQDSVLFNESLLYNLEYGNPLASREEIEKVLELCELKHFVSLLPQGLDTAVGERGLKLSGGEKQRVSIARALLKRPKIFIFDEATSSLDSQTEKEIQANIQAISQQHTTLIIAHRLSTIVDANEIIVLDNGEIAERGTHQTLLAKDKGIYARLWKRQNRTRQPATTSKKTY